MLEVSGKTPFYDGGLHFSCIRCSACCRYESGYVFLSKKDTELLGAALKMGYREFTQTYCRWIPTSDGMYQLSLREKSNFDCIFWDTQAADSDGTGGCSVYEARPLQCRAFPFWSSVLRSKTSWKMTAESCPGMGRGTLHSQVYIEKWLALREKEPIISRSESNKGES